MTHRFYFDIKTGMSLNRWLLTNTVIEPFKSKPETFDEPVNLTEEYVQVEYPVRKQFLKQRRDQVVDPSCENFDRIYFPFENPRVEFSSFIATPHTMRTYAKTFINSTQDGAFPFQLTTCGGVEIWVNSQDQLKYEPFTRNQPSSTEVELYLQKGVNEITVCFEDLAERDVNYFYEMTYKGLQPLQGFLPLSVPTQEITEVENILMNSYFEKDLFVDEDIRLHFGHDATKQVDRLHIRTNHNHLLNPVVGQKTNERGKKPSVFSVSLHEVSDENIVTLGHIDEFDVSGITYFDIGIELSNGVIIYRQLVASLYNKKQYALDVSENLTIRKKEVLNYFSSLSLDDMNIGMAKTVLNGYVNEEADHLIRSGFQVIEDKGDCADFRLAPLLGFTIQYKHLLSERLKQDIQSLATGFRYWIDEPGNDVMWYFSENHAFLFHVSQYFAGHLYSEDTFSVSGRTGKEQYRIGKERILDWFDIFFDYGFAEWNSTTYLPIDLIGFLSLYEAAPDKEIRALAKKALDLTFTVIAANLHGKTMSTTYGRVYEHDLKAMELGEVTNLAFIAWKEGYLNNTLRSTVLFCLSGYEPPELNQLITIPDDKGLRVEYKQGKKEVYTYLYKTKDYAMGSAIHFDPYLKGHQQHVMNVSLDDENTQFWINHPGEHVYSGENRPSFWAGNGICPNIRQYENVMMIEYLLKEPFIPFIHAYVPFWKLDEIEEEGNWFFMRRGTSYVAIYFDQGFQRIKEQAIAYREVRAYGNQHHVIVKCSSAKEVGSFQLFKRQMLESHVRIGATEWSYKDIQHGEMTMALDNELYVNNERVKYSAGYEIKSNVLDRSLAEG
ncbi:hypothetical protein [Pseudalkalibacillus hwajinpoensis]|uniref:hypothetical protein n=1 Tax=Guptibacillus hwajinpoensis TaxID=208199 RepID=UPI001CD76F98|nr:hypothetical protein [Pseudalkalibacillus hwajinpoensis]MCA0991348.1 hypothetical protein [Pseudalkalibacillus hwajinpoensis]